MYNCPNFVISNMKKRKPLLTISLEEINKHERIGHLLKELINSPGDEYILEELELFNFDHKKRAFKK